MSLIKSQKVFGEGRSISFILYIMEEGEINLNPEYQRDYVWGKTEQQNLMYSIFNQMPFGGFAIIEKPSDAVKADEPYIEAVDGKQRMTTIYKFYKNEIPYIQEDGTEIFFKDLEPVDQKSFKQISFTLNILAADITELEKYRYFYAVNFAGKPQSDTHREFVENKIMELKKAS